MANQPGLTPEHNDFLERVLHYPPGAVLDLWQAYLVPAAQLVLRDYAVKPPPAYEQLQGLGLGIDVGVGVGVGGSGSRALHARPGYGPGNLEGLSRRGAVRIPEEGEGWGCEEREWECFFEDEVEVC
ncbi:hypothetical protein Q7P35_001068 [Cladosporium inversicolor]